MAWAQLIRLPNVFTVLADVSAAFLLVAHGPQPLSRFVLVVLAGVSLYWAGMILNDVFDIDRDRQERPKRPLPAGHIALGQARFVGFALLGFGIAMAGGSGYVGDDLIPDTWLPLAIGIALAIMIVAYDGPLKKTPVAPVAMGACRLLSFLLGASPVLAALAIAEAPDVGNPPMIPKYVWATACGFGVYVMGVTTMGRNEATGGPSHNLPTGMIVIILGAIMLAFAPQLARNQAGFNVSTEAFAFMIGLIVLPVVLRAFRAVRDPAPLKIQTAIKMGILTIIPLSACYAFLGAGAEWGLFIFLLVVPSLGLASVFRVT